MTEEEKKEAMKNCLNGLESLNGVLYSLLGNEKYSNDHELLDLRDSVELRMKDLKKQIIVILQVIQNSISIPNQ